MEAFRHIITAGAEGLELDVHLTKDKVLAIHHDDSLKPAATRGPDGNWLTRPTPRLKDLTFNELQTFDVGRARPGSGFSARFPEQRPIDGARIPRLDDVIDLVRSEAPDDFLLYVELKTGLLDPEQAADPIALARACVDLVKAKAFERQTVFVSFDWRALAEAKRLAPDILNAFTTLPFHSIDPDHPSRDSDDAVAARIRAMSASGPNFYGAVDWRDAPGATFVEKMLRTIAEGPADGWFAWHGDVDTATCTLANKLGLTVSAWTVDDVEEMNRLSDLRVAAILTDRFDRMRTLTP